MLHRRRPWLHFLVLSRQLVFLAGGASGVLLFGRAWWWIPFAVLEGFILFDFTVMLHEVLHGLVFNGLCLRTSRFLELVYAFASGISPSQFTRWHLDHHAELGSVEGDPKRHHLSPKINRPWYKILYFTPALFFIYFRAAARESATYPESLRNKIAVERVIATICQLSLFMVIGSSAGWAAASRVYLVPVLLVFPLAFALNRLGQHYDIRPDDPAQWSTLMKTSWFWDMAFLWSNHHLEHHYFPGVPFYNLPRLRQLLDPYFQKKGMRPRGYVELLYHYLVLNKAPHTTWSLPQ